MPGWYRPVVLLLAAAVVSLQLGRAEHIHPAGIEGRTQSLIHRHALAPATTDGLRALPSHGDHRLAIFLALLYESALRHSYHYTPNVTPLEAAREHDPEFYAVGVVHNPVDRHPPGLTARAFRGRAPPLASPAATTFVL